MQFILFCHILGILNLTTLIPFTKATCYQPDGTLMSPTYAPCNGSAPASMCCHTGVLNNNGDVCGSGSSYGLCGLTGSQLWRESCTDPTWQSPYCLKLCVYGSADAMITGCPDGSYCCGQNNGTCCDSNQGLFIVNGQLTTALPQSAAVPQSTSSSEKPPDSTSQSSIVTAVLPQSTLTSEKPPDSTSQSSIVTAVLPQSTSTSESPPDSTSQRSSESESSSTLLVSSSIQVSTSSTFSPTLAAQIDGNKITSTLSGFVYLASSPTSSFSSPTSTSFSSSSISSIPAGTKIGIGVGVPAVVCCILALVFIFYKAKKGQMDEQRQQELAAASRRYGEGFIRGAQSPGGGMKTPTTTSTITPRSSFISERNSTGNYPHTFMSTTQASRIGMRWVNGSWHDYVSQSYMDSDEGRDRNEIFGGELDGLEKERVNEASIANENRYGYEKEQKSPSFLRGIFEWGRGGERRHLYELDGIEKERVKNAELSNGASFANENQYGDEKEQKSPRFLRAVFEWGRGGERGERRKPYELDGEERRKRVELA